MSENLRHCYACRHPVEAILTPAGWLHCPRCGANIGFNPTRNREAVVADVTFTGQELPSSPYTYTAPAMESYDKAVWEAMTQCEAKRASPNPKTLMGRQKLSLLSVVPPASIICEAEAMHYGAFEAPRKDGSKGYGPYNWRDDPVELMIYIDACLRHIFAFVDGENRAEDSLATHIGHAKACLGIIADAQANGTLLDDRPKVRHNAAAKMLAEWKQIHAIHTGEPK